MPSPRVALAAAALLLVTGIPTAPAEVAPAEPFVVAFDALPRDVAPGDRVLGADVLAVLRGLRALVLAAPDSGWAARAAREPGVRYVHADARVVAPHFVPDDARWSEQYGPSKIGATTAWEHTWGGDGRALCVVDTGILHGHEDLADGRLVQERDFADDDLDASDDDGHGTHVAGIATGTLGNGKGIAGIAQVPYRVARVLGQDNGSVSDLAQGLEWCADQGAGVITTSVGTDEPYAILEDAIEYAHAEGSLVVASAGNEGCSPCVLYPATYAETIAVGCTDSADALCEFSSQGPQVDLAAPGLDVLSSYASGGTSYRRLSGTSMSAPHVAGAASLLWSAYPALSRDEVRDALEDTALDLGAAGRDNQFGHGRVDVARALAAVRPDPPLSASLSVDFDGGSAPGFSLTGLWHVDSACEAPPSAPRYLGYHRSGACDFTNSNVLPTAGKAEIDVDLAGVVAARLSVAHRFETEQSNEAVDVRTIEVSEDGGSTWTVLARWDARDANQLAWQTFDVSLRPYVGGSVRLRFAFDSVDGFDNGFEGWMIDDVRVLTATNWPPTARARDARAADADGNGAATVTLRGGESGDVDGPIASWEWLDASGGAIATGATASISLAVGAHALTLRVTDEDGATATTGFTATVTANAPPLADAGPDASVTDGDSNGVVAVALSALRSSDPDGPIVSYSWIEGGATIATGATPTVELPLGDHALTLRVADEGGLADEDEILVHVGPNAPPVAVANVECAVLACTFRASRSTDSDGAIQAYEWSFGDGATGMGATATHAYLVHANFTVTLAVEDDSGAIGEASLTREVGHTVFEEDFDDGAAEDFALPSDWHVGSACASARSAPHYLGFHRQDGCYFYEGDPAGVAFFAVDLAGAEAPRLSFAHAWDVRDTIFTKLELRARPVGGSWTTLQQFHGGSSGWTTNERSLASYAGQSIEIGFSYRGEDTFRSGKGWWIDDVRVTAVPPQGPEPVARAGPDLSVGDGDGDGSETVALDGTASTDVDGTIVAFEWRENGALLATGATPLVTLATGTHTLLLRVVDDDGLADEDVLFVQVGPNSPPVARAGLDQSRTDFDGDGAETFLLDGSASADADGLVVSHEWLAGGALVATGVAPSLTLPVGTHDVTLRVADNAGAIATDVVRLVVEPNPPPVAGFGWSCAGLACRFSAPCSYDPDGSALSYSWQFGDGATSAEESPLYAFAAAGTYPVSLTTRDAAGMTDAITRSVLVHATSPLPAPSGPPSNPEVRDTVTSPVGDILPAPHVDVESAWLVADGANLHVGLSVLDIPLASAAAADVSYVVQLQPAYAVADPTWGGAVPAGYALRHLYVLARGGPVFLDDGFPGLDPEGQFELHALAQTAQGVTKDTVLATIPGTIDAGTDVVWWTVPLSGLQSPGGGARFASPQARAGYMGVGSVSPTTLMDLTGIGRDYVVPGACAT